MQFNQIGRKENKTVFYYKTSRGNFRVEIIELSFVERREYKDIVVDFCVNISNEDYLDWKIEIDNPRGMVRKIEDKDKLIKKLKNKIKEIINKDEQGCFCIGDRYMNLT